MRHASCCSECSLLHFEKPKAIFMLDSVRRGVFGHRWPVALSSSGANRRLPSITVGLLAALGGIEVANAIGLGDVSQQSALGEPLRIVGDLSPGGGPFDLELNPTVSARRRAVWDQS